MAALSLLDASALIAVADQERGWEAVPDPATALITSINAAEVITHLVQTRGSPDVVLRFVRLMCPIVDITTDDALEAGALHAATRKLRLSMADCVCLVHAQKQGYRAVTSDKAWSQVDIGVQVIQFR